MEDLFERIGRGFRGLVLVPEAAVVLGVAVLASVGGLLLFFSVRRGGGGRRQAEFRRFAGIHGLTRTEERILWKIAMRKEMRTPALLFVRRSLFEEEAAAGGLDPARLESIRRKVWGP